MNDGVLFPPIPNPHMRGLILARLESLGEPIISFHTYLKDAMILELTAKPLRLLLPPRWTGDLLSCFRRIFETENRMRRIPLQCSERRLVHCDCRADLAFRIACAQLFLHNMRHFDSLTGVTPLKQRGKPKPEAAALRFIASLSKLARLAHKSGFRSDQIQSLCEGNADEQMVRNFLYQLRPVEDFEYTAGDMEEIVQEICRLVRRLSQPVEPVDRNKYLFLRQIF